MDTTWAALIILAAIILFEVCTCISDNRKMRRAAAKRKATQPIDYSGIIREREKS